MFSNTLPSNGCTCNNIVMKEEELWQSKMATEKYMYTVWVVSSFSYFRNQIYKSEILTCGRSCLPWRRGFRISELVEKQETSNNFRLKNLLQKKDVCPRNIFLGCLYNYPLNPPPPPPESVGMEHDKTRTVVVKIITFVIVFINTYYTLIPGQRV
jgi:hypothetical protein